MVWWNCPEFSDLGNASWKIHWLIQISKLESQLQDWSMCKINVSSHHYALDQRSWDSKVNRRSYDIAIDYRTKSFPDYDDRYLRGRQIAYMIYQYFPVLDVYEAVQGLSDLFNRRWQNDDVQDFDARWDQALLAVIEIPAEMVLEVYTRQKYRILFSFKLYWLCMIKRLFETLATELFKIEDISKTSYWSDNEDAKLQSPERNSGKRSSNQETKMEKSPARKGRWENAISGKELDTVRKETHVVSVMLPRLETDAVRDKKDKCPLLHQKRRHRLMGRHPQKVQGAEGRVLLEQHERFRAEIS